MLSKQALLQAYRKMREIRTFEERLHQENTSGDIPGFIHLYTGEEAIAVGVCENLTSADFIGSTHRGHGHCIAKGCDIHGMMAEIFGKDSGLCRGKGGSMHIADLSKGMLGANAIVGGAPPLAIGAALTAKTLKTGNVGVSFTGDGGSNQAWSLKPSIWPSCSSFQPSLFSRITVTAKGPAMTTPWVGVISPGAPLASACRQ